MLNLPKYIVLCASCALIAHSAFAESFEYDLDKKGSEEQPIYLACTVLDQNNKIVDDSSKIFLYAHSERIKGFSANEGSKEMPISELNQTYFEAYHDPSPWHYFFNGELSGETEIVTYSVQCQFGKGEGRHGLSGSFETSQGSKVEY